MRRTRAAVMTALLLTPLLSVACNRGVHAEDGPDEASAPGAATAEESCVGCHAGAQLDAVVRRRVAEKDANAALDAFLARHHVPDAALRADVVAYLVARLEAAPGTE